jgi:ribosomal protein S18 acetylase RimI-like enzyme
LLVNKIVIKKIGFEEWSKFNESFPYEQFEGKLKDFQKDCILNCNPNMMGPNVIGAFIGDDIVGMLSYCDKYYISKDVIEDGKPVNYRELIGEKTKNSIPITFIYSLIVHPSKRQKGVATELINYLINHSKQDYLMMYPVSPECRKLGDKLGFVFDSNIFIRLGDVIYSLK